MRACKYVERAQKPAGPAEDLHALCWRTSARAPPANILAIEAKDDDARAGLPDCAVPVQVKSEGIVGPVGIFNLDNRRLSALDLLDGFIGKIAILIGPPPYGGDIGFELSGVFVAVPYPVFRLVEKRLVGR
ncbi:hypothetical protein JCM3770_003952 [Rhodotorula araucariae]